jgi:hypothetical protein
METGEWRAARLACSPEDLLLTLAIDGGKRPRVEEIDPVADVLDGSPDAWLVVSAVNGGTPTAIDVRPGLLDATFAPADLL